MKTKTLTVDLRQVKIHLSIIVALLHGLDNKEFNDTKYSLNDTKVWQPTVDCGGQRWKLFILIKNLNY